MKPIVYFDLDGVLADFDGHYTHLMGSPWMARNQANDQKKWKNLEAHPTFFLDLPWMPGAYWMYQAVVASSKFHVGILSAASRHFPGSMEQKHEWCKRNTPEVWAIHRIIVERAKDKAQHVHPKAILVDDLQENIDNWRTVGGYGIHFTSAEQSLRELRQFI